MQLEIDKTCLQGQLIEQESMARHTSWKTGGNADYFYKPENIEDLALFLAAVPASMPIIWVGYGSNLLVRDGGFEGVVISVTGILDRLNKVEPDQIEIGAGVSCVKAVKFAAKQGLSGIEFLAGIPGTIGGALAMNAGAWGGETWNSVIEVELLNRKGERIRRGKDSFDIAYRIVSLGSDEWFTSVLMKLNQSSKEKVETAIRLMLDERAAAQPLGQLSCGSVFRNPPDDHAARLIEACGLKGKQFGGACVSVKHANFIINTGSATTKDIESLIQFVQQTVNEQQGVMLMPEVRIIGSIVGDQNGAMQ